MKKHKVLRLKTPKGEDVLVNFENVSHITPTNSNHSSVRFDVSHGKDKIGIFLVLEDGINTIKQKLSDNLNNI